MFKRIHLIVLDSVGIGAQHDAKEFGDEGTHTLRHLLEDSPVTLGNLEKLGLGCIDKLPGVGCPETTQAFHSKMAELSQGKDTMTGHWEIAGIISPKPLPTYPDGFPKDVIDEFVKETGREILCNKRYSGTEESL